jgi:hypothetical protein
MTELCVIKCVNCSEIRKTGVSEYPARWFSQNHVGCSTRCEKCGGPTICHTQPNPAMETDTKFWMVWAENDDLPKVKHWEMDKAIQEAERLAMKHPRETFYVLEAKAGRRFDAITNIELIEDEIPF